MDESLAGRVREVLRRLGPSLAVDGGGVELERVEGSTVYLRFTGACVGCPGSDITLKYGLESTLKEEIPEITRVIAAPEEGTGEGGA